MSNLCVLIPNSLNELITITEKPGWGYCIIEEYIRNGFKIIKGNKAKHYGTIKGINNYINYFGKKINEKIYFDGKIIVKEQHEPFYKKNENLYLKYTTNPKVNCKLNEKNIYSDFFFTDNISESDQILNEDNFFDMHNVFLKIFDSREKEEFKMLFRDRISYDEFLDFIQNNFSILSENEIISKSYDLIFIEISKYLNHVINVVREYNYIKTCNKDKCYNKGYLFLNIFSEHCGQSFEEDRIIANKLNHKEFSINEIKNRLYFFIGQTNYCDAIRTYNNSYNQDEKDFLLFLISLLNDNVYYSKDALKDIINHYAIHYSNVTFNNFDVDFVNYKELQYLSCLYYINNLKCEFINNFLEFIEEFRSSKNDIHTDDLIYNRNENNRDNFYALTDGQLGDIDDFSGNFDEITEWSGI